MRTVVALATTAAALLSFHSTFAAAAANNNKEKETYGVDVSFPMHHSRVSDNYAWLPHNVDSSNNPTPARYKDMAVQPLGNRQALYEEMIAGCRDYYKDKGLRCNANERERVAMSLRQPQSMTNYTDIGFKKIKAPAHIFQMIQKFWNQNKGTQKQENWPAGNTYTNHWKARTYMVSVEDRGLRGGGPSLKQHIWDAARDTIQEWTGEELTQCSLYGVRVYTEGAILSSHVDRLPLVSSAIINVDQDVDEPWPLEVIGHDGKAHNVTMEPGDMVLYESHSILHGRPYPLKGRFYANIFIHFEPTGHSLRHNARIAEEEKNKGGVDQKYKQAVANGIGGHEATHDAGGGLPPYIIQGTPEEANWRRSHPQGFQKDHHPRSIGSFATGSTSAHSYAQKGNLAGLQKEITSKGKHLVNTPDENGWTPFHEAVRGGHEDVVKYLFDNGASINQRTNGGDGGSPLYLAISNLGKTHPVSQFLERMGGEFVEPEL